MQQQLGALAASALLLLVRGDSLRGAPQAIQQASRVRERSLAMHVQAEVRATRRMQHRARQGRARLEHGPPVLLALEPGAALLDQLRGQAGEASGCSVCASHADAAGWASAGACAAAFTRAGGVRGCGWEAGRAALLAGCGSDVCWG